MNQSKINRFLSDKTGMWKNERYGFYNHKRRVDTDFFIPDGMVRLMEWLAKEGLYVTIGCNQDVIPKWHCEIERNSIARNEVNVEADTLQSALAQAALKALGGDQ